MEQRLVLVSVVLALAAAATVVSGQNVCSGISIGQPVITFQNVDAQGALTLTGNLVLDNNNDGDLAINKVEVAIRLTGQTATRNVAAQCPATSDSTSITCTFTANIMYGMPVPTSGPLATLYGVVTIGTTPCNGTATTVNASPSATITINSGSNEAGAATPNACANVVVGAPVVTDRSLTSINGQGMLSVTGTVALTNTAGTMLSLEKVEVAVTLNGAGITRTLLADCPGSTSALTVTCNFQADIMFQGAISMVPSVVLKGVATLVGGGTCPSAATTVAMNTGTAEAGTVAATTVTTKPAVVSVTQEAGTVNANTCSALAIDAPVISAVTSSGTVGAITVAVAGSVVLTNLGNGVVVNVQSVAVQVRLTGQSATGSLNAVCPVSSTPAQSVTCTFQGSVRFTGSGSLPATFTGIATLTNGVVCQGATTTSNAVGSVNELAAAQAVMDANAAAATATGITTTTAPNTIVIYRPIFPFTRSTGGKIIYHG